MKSKNYLILAGILGIHLILLISLKFTAWPEMSLWPYLMSRGWLPYRDIAIAHTPLLLIDLAIVYKFFGAGILSLKIFTWVLILVSDLLVFAVVKKLWGKKTAFISLSAYVLWLMIYDGNGLWFDLYMGVLAFASFYFVRVKKWFCAGVLWALAFLSKQTAVWFLLPIFIEIIDGKWSMIKNILRRPCRGYPFKVVSRFAIGVIAVIVPFVLLLFIFQLLPSFWEWTVKFGIFTLPKAQGQIQLPGIRTLVLSILPFSLFLPFLLTKPKNKVRNLVLATWAFAGAMGAYPRFEYFHFLPAIPYLAIATGIFLADIKKHKKFIRILAAIYVLGSVFYFAGYFIRNIGEGTRFYGQDVQDTVLYIKYNTEAGDRIFVLNWWDNLYAFTDTVPATDPWVPQLSWYMEIPGIQEGIVEDLKDNPPEIIIFNPYTDFGLSSYVPEKVYEFVVENYTLSEKVNGLKILTRKQYAYRDSK